MEALLDGWERGLRLLREQPEEGARLAARYLAMTPDELGEALDGIQLVSQADNERLFDRSTSHSIWGTVGAAERGGFVEFRVEDRGPGVPAAQRARIFERFHQVQSPS